MTPLSPARRDAEAFADALDGVRGDGAERYSDLLTCVDVLRAQDIPAPRADFVADLRMRLMDAADTILVPTERLAPVVPLRAPAAARRQRRISIAAAAFVVIGGTAGVAAASENSLPGDPLYPIKRGIESAQISFSSSDAGKGQDLLRIAGTRLDEVGGLLAANSNSDQINSTLAAFRSSAADGAGLLFVDYQHNGDSADISGLRATLGSQLAKLDSLSSEAPPSTKSGFEAARSELGNLDQQASVLCGDCGAGGISDNMSTSPSPSLAALLNAPSATGQASGQVQRGTDLANKAGHVAQTLPTTPVDPTAPSVSPSTPPIGVPISVPPGPGGIKNPLGGLTSGVSTLLSNGHGTPLAPVTDVVGTTLDTLTKGLLGK